jgi:asparagine synthase (glutamine-hydrolysing)
MPGICGIVDSTRSGIALETVLGAMQECLAQEPWYARAEHSDLTAGCGLASVSLGFSTQGPKLTWNDATGCGLAFDGELYDVPQLAEELRQSGETVDVRNHAAILLAGYRLQGKVWLQRLQGSFAAALWDGPQRQLTLLTDRFGTRPLYYCHSRDGFRFASSMGALLAASDEPRTVNARGLAQFFAFGHYLRDDTALENVHALPAGACYTFCAQREVLERGTYWTLADAKMAGPAQPRDWLPLIDEAFKEAVRRRTTDTPHLGLSLSGGLDARTILGVIDTQQTPLQTICMGVQGSLDHRSSAELSRLAGCQYHPHVLDGSFLDHFRQHLERMVALTDGQYLSQCIIIPTLKTYRELGIQTLLRGHAGELMHMRKAYNYSLDDNSLQIRTDPQLHDWLFKRLQAFLLDGVQEPLFTAPYQDNLRELSAQSLAEELAEVAHIERPLDRIWPLFIAQRLRRETSLSMVKFRSVVEPRLPYLDNDLVSLLLSAPAELKLDEEIQAYILRRRRPEFLRVTNTNTGAAVGASPWRRRAATFQMKVLSKLGVPGYQPYERLGLWLRRELAPVVRDILLDPRTLDRGVFRPAGIRAVVRRHLEQGHNHTFLLMALMIFELGLRRLVDVRSGAALPTLLPESATH